MAASCILTVLLIPLQNRSLSPAELLLTNRRPSTSVAKNHPTREIGPMDFALEIAHQQQKLLQMRRHQSDQARR
jgi:hypothetical protein